MSSGWPGKHIDSGAWHTCQRSGIRANLDDMVWEMGILVAPEFSDLIDGGRFGILGTREADIARHLRQDTSDLQPHPKLSFPNTGEDFDVYF